MGSMKVRRLKRVLKSGLIVSISLYMAIFHTLQNVQAFDGEYDENFFGSNGIYFYNPEDKGITCTTSSVIGDNLDYAGRQVYNSAQLEMIKENQHFYEKAVEGKDIPWQMLAAMHTRESGLRRYGPGNGYGPFQITPSNYKVGDYSDSEFQTAANEAADFMIGKASGKDLNDPENVKYTFFAYNGIASVYIQQAKDLGFSDEEAANGNGSPYVVNKIDEKRDPEKNSSGWGQIKTDYGSISYPANNDYGAFVYYVALGGNNNSLSTGGCSSTITGTVREKIVKIAEQEYNLYKDGSLKPGTDFTKYTGGTQDQWCAWFVSWVYKQADVPLSSSDEGRVPLVAKIQSIGEENGSFQYHKNDGSYIPQPGDLAIYGAEHVNIVVSIDGSTIGGNEGGESYSYYDSSRVNKTVGNGYSSTATGYVSPK